MKRKRKTLWIIGIGGLVLVIVGLAVFGFWFWQERQFPTREREYFGKILKQEETPVASLSAEIEISPVPDLKTLLPTPQVYQTFNNCGPATIAMILGYYQIERSQDAIGQDLRPYQHPKGDNDDKTIFPAEFAAYIENFGLKTKLGVGGTISLIKLLIANDLPVVVKQWLRPKDDIGHFRIVRGFDESKPVLVADDSYDGPSRKIAYEKFLALWQPFNYGFIVVYQPEKESLVKAILGEDWRRERMYKQALARAIEEEKMNPENVYPVFNQATSLYHLGRYQEAVVAFEKVEKRLPRRMLWYQIEPILAYYELGNYQRVFEISDYLFTHGNRAFSELYQLRGEIFLAQGKKAEAKRELELALKYNRNFQPAKDTLERF